MGDDLGTYDEFMSTEIEMPAIDGCFAPIPAQDVSVSEWLGELVLEGILQSGSRTAVIETPKSIEVGDSDAWQGAVRRLVMVYRACIADARRSHISEAAFVWRYITKDQLKDLMELILRYVPSKEYRFRDVGPACVPNVRSVHQH